MQDIKYRALLIIDFACGFCHNFEKAQKIFIIFVLINRLQKRFIVNKLCAIESFVYTIA